LAARKFFPNNIHRANYHFTHSKKLKKLDNTTIPLLGDIMSRKRPQQGKGINAASRVFLKKSDVDSSANIA
jgi:hypothetical protein